MEKSKSGAIIAEKQHIFVALCHVQQMQLKSAKALTVALLQQWQQSQGNYRTEGAGSMPDANQLLEPTGSDEWITALEAVHLIAPTFGGDEPAKSTILSRLEDGAIDCRATSIVQEADIGKVDFDCDGSWGYEPRSFPRQRDEHWCKSESEAEAFFATERGFMSKDDGWVIDPGLISWQYGHIVARRPATFKRPLKSKVRVILPPTKLVRPTASIKESEAFIRRAVSALMFKLSDIEAIIIGPLNTNSKKSGSGIKAADPRPDKMARGKLPASAKPNDRKYEEYAHQAAEIVRSEGVPRSEAFRRVAPMDNMRNESSITHAIRHSYDLMYDHNGHPRQN